jgi:transcriptional regulator with XRE-family HTH domain
LTAQKKPSILKAEKGGHMATSKDTWKAVSGLQETASRIGRNLRVARGMAELTLGKLSEMTKAHHPANRSVTARRISLIERGLGNPDLMELQLICLVLEKALREVIRRDFPLFARNTIGAHRPGLKTFGALHVIENLGGDPAVQTELELAASTTGSQS